MMQIPLPTSPRSARCKLLQSSTPGALSRSNLARRAARSRTASCSSSLKNYDTSSRLELGGVRAALVDQEDGIIFGLLRRSKYMLNAAAYSPAPAGEGGVLPRGYPTAGWHGSLLDLILMETEGLHAKIRRYTSPDEHAFFPDALPLPAIPALTYPNDPLIAGSKDINFNSEVMDLYMQVILPQIAEEGDDGNYGSAVLNDIGNLQILSRRIHMGKFVAEAKFREDPQGFERLIRENDAEGIMSRLTYPEQEIKVAERVRLKAAVHGQEIEVGGNLDPTLTSSQGKVFKIEPDVVANLYIKHVMPLTKRVQVAYLLRRLG